MGVIVSASSAPGADWNDFVAGHAGASIYHRAEWGRFAAEVFGHQGWFLEARDAAAALTGILPLVRQRSVLFGDMLTSLPFFNYGGTVSLSREAEALLMERARRLADELGCKYLELRSNGVQPCDWQVRTDKVSMILELPESLEAMHRAFGAKLRSQVKRADREKSETFTGGAELLPQFYAVFSRGMRDLGTPVYSRRFFGEMLQRFPQNCRITCITMSGRPVAAGFVILNGKDAEIPWAACVPDAKPLGMNMKLYWEVLTMVHQHGSRRFDFGRSTNGSGTYRFKAQWGAQPRQLYWYRWSRNVSAGTLPAQESTKMQRAIAIWKRLPLPVANVLGPMLSPGLPW